MVQKKKPAPKPKKAKKVAKKPSHFMLLQKVWNAHETLGNAITDLESCLEDQAGASGDAEIDNEDEWPATTFRTYP